MIRKYIVPFASLLIFVGMVILISQYFIFLGLSQNVSHLFPPAGQALNPEQTSFSVAIFSDFASRVDSVEKIGMNIAKTDTSFVLCLGDVVRKRTHPDFIHVVNEIREHIKLPVYAVPGNWDRSDSDRWETYRSYFGQDYYFFGYGDTLFLALNTAEGNLPEAQRFFLAQTLKRERPHFSRCVIFCHIPPQFPGSGNNHVMNPQDAETFMEIIKPYKIDLIVCGHVHRFTESSFAGIRLLTTPSAGQNIRDPNDKMFGYLLLDFSANGSIQVRRIDVTSDTGIEDWDYFFSVQLCGIGWFLTAIAVVVSGSFLLWRKTRTGGSALF